MSVTEGLLRQAMDTRIPVQDRVSLLKSYSQMHGAMTFPLVDISHFLSRHIQ